MVKPIVAFHAEIPVVREDGGVVVVAADFDDWYSEPEVLEKLRAACPGIRSFGELVGRVKTARGFIPQSVSGLVSCCIKSGTHSGGAKGWDDRI